MNINWTSDLSVGDHSIDDDHKELFALIDELDSADMSHDYINSILDRLKAYTRGHFSREEEYLKKAGFPGLEEHLKQHESFIAWLQTIRPTYAPFHQSTFIFGASVNRYLQSWLLQNILEEDLKHRVYIAGQQSRAPEPGG